MNVHLMMENAIRQERIDYKKRLRFIKSNKDEYFRIANGLIVIQEYVMRFSFDIASLDIHVAGDHHVFNGMFGALRKLGYNCESKPKDKIMASWCCWWHQEGCSSYRDPDPKLWVSFNSTKCRRVQIGTKMVEQIIYETVCD